MIKFKRPSFNFAPGSDWCTSTSLEAIEKGAEFASEYAYTPSQTPCEGFPTYKMTLEVMEKKGKSLQNFRFASEKQLEFFLDYLSNIHGSKVETKEKP